MSKVSINDWYKDTDATFEPFSENVAIQLLKFHGSKLFKSMIVPEINIDGITYKFEHYSSSYNNRLKTRGHSMYYSINSNTIIRISDHWSKSDQKSKKFNCSFIASCYWEIYNSKPFKYSGSVFMAGILPINKFTRKRTVSI